MSAWARLVAKASPEELEELNAAMMEIQTEQRRKDAEKQRKLAAPAAMLRSERMQGFAEGARAAADLIDPEPDNRRCDMREAHTWHRWTKDGITYVCKSVVLNSG